VNRWPREFAAWLAALTGVVLLGGVLSFAPKRVRYAERWVPVHGQPCNEPNFELVRVFTGNLEWSGSSLTAAELEVGLNKRKRTGPEPSVVYVDEVGPASVSGTVQVLQLLKRLNLHAVIVSSATERDSCRLAEAARTADSLRREMVASSAVQIVPWWRLW